VEVASPRRIPVLRAALFVLLALPGCADFWVSPSDELLNEPPTPLAVEEEPQPAESTTAGPQRISWGERPIGQDLWARTFVDPKHPDDAPSRRWRHALLEGPNGELLAEAPTLYEAAEQGSEIALANAALLILRHDFAPQEGSPAPQYQAIIAKTSLPMNLRCAAADSLADAGDEGLALAIKLLNEQAAFAERRSAKRLAELHEELLRGVARHESPTVSPAFASALADDNPRIRLVAAEAWATVPAADIPERLVDLTRDPDASVRRAAIHALAQSGHPRTLEVAKNNLFDPQLEVHLAAIEALGHVDHPDAIELLLHEAESDGNLFRAAAISALAARGKFDSVLAAAKDSDSKVREASAAALAKISPEHGLAAARELIADRSMAVRRSAIQAVATWPIADAAPLLFNALSDRAVDTRQAAARSLEAHWPEIKEFRPLATAEERETQLAELRQRFQSSLGEATRTVEAAASPAVAASMERDRQESTEALAKLLVKLESCAADSPEQRAALEQLSAWPGDLEADLMRLVNERGVIVPDAVYDYLLAAAAPKHFVDWSTATDAEKRQLVGWFAASVNEQPFRPLIVRRLIALVTLENDPLLWQSVLELCRVHSDTDVRRFAAAALGHDSPEVRRRAGEYFANFPGEDAIPWLQATLADETSYVAATAARAIARCGRPADLEPLAQLALRDEIECRLAAAATLTHFDDERGRAALERLAFDPDAKVRIQAVQTMGELADPEFAAALVTLLDDDLGIRRAALASLPLVTNHELSAEESASTQSQATAWKRWTERR
jgi:HEAT repeat protein